MLLKRTAVAYLQSPSKKFLHSKGYFCDTFSFKCTAVGKINKIMGLPGKVQSRSRLKQSTDLPTGSPYEAKHRLYTTNENCNQDLTEENVILILAVY